MSYTIEAVNAKISGKISQTKEIIGRIETVAQSNIFSSLTFIPDELATMTKNIDELLLAYNLAVVDIISRYYSNNSAGLERINTEEYYKLIIREGFVSKLDEYNSVILSIVDAMLRHMSKTLCPQSRKSAAIARIEQPDENNPASWMGTLSLQNNCNYSALLKAKKQLSCKSNKLDITIRDLYLFSGDNCSCDSKVTSVDTFDAKCHVCGRVKNIDKLIIVDHQNGRIVNPNNRAKNNGYDPNRHFDDWMDDILAEGNFDFTADQWSAIDYIIARDKPQLMYVEEARDILKEAKLTKFNNHASLIMKKRGKYPPPRISGKVRVNASMLFDRIVKLIDLVMEEKQSSKNRSYYPHFIYFIYDIEAARAKADNRDDDYAAIRDLQKRCIYLQSTKTMVRNDKKLSKICELDQKFAEEEFAKTGKSRDYLKFRPTVKRIKN